MRPMPAKSGHAGFLRKRNGGSQSRRGRTRQGDEDHAQTLVTRTKGGDATAAWDIGVRG
jgi:hypothetical protein